MKHPINKDILGEEYYRFQIHTIGENTIFAYDKLIKRDMSGGSLELYVQMEGTYVVNGNQTLVELTDPPKADLAPYVFEKEGIPYLRLPF